ncbi:DUF2384 domain-containing protein [Burkholderiaceae bacterium DAT-1]|nr:DUF2384 domain-containing protein [Burkholderiaceae bacterium DAT-1]
MAHALGNFRQVYEMPLIDRVGMIQDGVPATEFKELVADMNMPQAELARVLRIPVATVNRKASRLENLTIDDSERLVNLAALIGQVQKMVDESGDPTGFDAPRWVADWIESPLPALNGKRPADYLGTSAGFTLVSGVLTAMQAGAYL